MIDIHQEQLLSLRDATRHVPGRPHVSTLIRWAMHGLGGVTLDTVKVGGRRFTSLEAIQRFLVRMNDPDVAGSATPSREQELRVVEKRLDAEGIR